MTQAPKWNWNSDGVKPADTSKNIPYPGPSQKALPKILSKAKPQAKQLPLQTQKIPKQAQQLPKTLGSFKKGGKVKKTGVYRLHKGERVLSKNQFKKTMDKVFHGKA